MLHIHQKRSWSYRRKSRGVRSHQLFRLLFWRGRLPGTDIRSHRKTHDADCVQISLRAVGDRLNAEGWDGELIIAPYAVSDSDGIVTFNDIGKPEGGYLPENRQTLEYNDKLAPVETIELESRSIDGYVPPEERITLIKMDIEGAEFAALKGAEKTIRKYRPRLAISIYHNPADYWRLCELIHQFCPEYKFAVRHHQTYCHKILTGRKEAILCEDKYKSVTGFSNPRESEYDPPSDIRPLQ